MRKTMRKRSNKTHKKFRGGVRKIHIRTTPVIIEATPPTSMKTTYVELMENLGFIMRKRGDNMRAKAYANAKDAIQSYPCVIVGPEQLKGLAGIGPSIYEKLVEFSKSNSLRILEEETATLQTKKAMDVFAGIYGVGEKKAEELVNAGITTLEQLQLKQDEVLNDKQRVGLKYYNDIAQRIPRAEIQQYETIFRTATDTQMEIVGSYRRGAADSGDIDVILTSDNPAVFVKFVDALVASGIIVEVLSRGKSKCLVVAKLPEAQYARRVDFLFATPAEYPFAVLYFTGSKEFNVVMRENALNLGYSLNEHGLSHMENRKKGSLVEQVFADENAIFEFLKMEYKAPSERVLVAEHRKPMATKKTKKLLPEKLAVEPFEKPVVEPIEKPVVEPPVKPSSPEKLAVEPTEKKKRTTKKVRVKSVDAELTAFRNGNLTSLTEEQLASVITVANDAYYTKGKPIMTDAEYDLVHDYFAKTYPSNPVLQGVGAPVEKNKVALPYEMASMDKIKPDTNALAKWAAKYSGPYTLSCKLDGISGLYDTENAVPKLYTRGDGTVGQDISHLIPHIRLPKNKDIVIRGEFIMEKTVFDRNYKTKYANARNLMAGIINQKTIDDRVKDVRFVAYEVVKPAGLKPSEQMALLKTMDVDVVKNQQENHLTNELLSALLQTWRTGHEYEIDGVIVADDKVYGRASGNPDNAFAFKMILSDQMAEAHVVDVLWSPSKDGYLKPRVQINPVHLGGVVIQYATGFNAKFIEDNKIGVGAIIQIIRSGDVIPKIQSVSAPAIEAKMPSVAYVWNDTHVDIMLEDATGDATVVEKNLTGFFKGIEVDGLGPKNVEKLMAAGHDTVPKILRMSKDDFLKVDGFQDKTATKLYDGIRTRIDAASLATLMAVSNKLGRGISSAKSELILAEYPDVFVERDMNKLVAIKGVEKKTAQTIIDHIPDFLAFMTECGLEGKMTTVPKPTVSVIQHELTGKSIVFSGVRDKALEEWLKSVGAKSGSSVSKNTFAVVVKSHDETTGKVENAKALGVPVMTLEEFRGKYK